MPYTAKKHPMTHSGHGTEFSLEDNASIKCRSFQL